MIKGEKIPIGKVNLYSIKIEDKYGTDLIMFCSNLDYNYNELEIFIRMVALESEDKDELVDYIVNELDLWYVEGYKLIQIKMVD